MLDSHAHIGDSTYPNGLVCTSSPITYPSGYRFNSIGLIPEGGSDDVKKLEEYASKGFLIGEIGLDKRYPDLDKQLRLFKTALTYARKYNRFISIHQVGYPELILNTLKEYKIDNFLIHGYTGSYEMAKRYISIGGLISLSPRAERTKDFLRLITLDFVTETDMPMSKDEDITLKTWNTKLSLILNKDIETISEELLLERIDV